MQRLGSGTALAPAERHQRLRRGAALTGWLFPPLFLAEVWIVLRSDDLLTDDRTDPQVLVGALVGAASLAALGGLALAAWATPLPGASLAARGPLAPTAALVTSVVALSTGAGTIVAAVLRDDTLALAGLLGMLLAALSVAGLGWSLIALSLSRSDLVTGAS